jgi:CheY-like chemotaxis protein
MVINTSNVLIVEDEDDWCAIYERTARREGFSTIRVAKTFKEAERLIQSMQFAVAFIDVGLDVGDDRNIDGLRVMEKIQEVGDGTSIIVVTGRSGRDVLPITRDAIKKYHAYDAVAKAQLEPSELRRLLEGGMKVYKKAASSPLPAVYHVLRGSVPLWKWDNQVLRCTRIEGGVDVLYRFLESLFARFLPVIASEEGGAVRVNEVSGLAYGVFWSRALGDAVAICFGPDQEVNKAIDAAQSGGVVLSDVEIKAARAVLHEASAGAVRGVVFALSDAKRENFPLI